MEGGSSGPGGGAAGLNSCEETGYVETTQPQGIKFFHARQKNITCSCGTGRRLLAAPRLLCDVMYGAFPIGPHCPAWGCWAPAAPGMVHKAVYEPHNSLLIRPHCHSHLTEGKWSDYNEPGSQANPRPGPLQRSRTELFFI